MRRIIKSAFSTSLLSDYNIKKFVVGDYPDAMQYSRPFHLSRLDNGVTVASEIMPNNISSISVFIKCGSRNETAESSGTAHFLEHLHFKGTKNMTRDQLQVGVQNMGGSLNAYTSRENTCYMMTVFKDDLSRAVQIVGDMITNSLYRKPDVENERSTIYRQLLETQKSMPMETTIELAHRGVYQNHQMGLPILGSIQNMQTISQQMIKAYHDENYSGDNIIVVAAGNINHAKLEEDIYKYIKVSKREKSSSKLERPKFVSGITSLESHLTEKVNLVMINEAPSFFDNEFFTYLLLQRILSDRPETNLQVEIMKNSQLFKFQKHLAAYDFIEKQKGFFSSYWDTGLFGNYLLVDTAKAQDAIKLCFEGLSKYASSVTDQEIERAKRKVFMEVLQQETQNDITQSIGNNIMYYDRRVHTKELAERVACVGASEIQSLCSKLIDPAKVHVCFWGNVKAIPFLQK